LGKGRVGYFSAIDANHPRHPGEGPDPGP